MTLALLIFGIIIFAFLAAFILSGWMIYRAMAKHTYYDKARGAEMQKAAAEIGWKFVAEGETGLIPSIANFSPGEDNFGMLEGVPIKIENAILGAIGGNRAAVFDCVYHDLASAVTDVKSSRQTMAFIEIKEANFPMFFLTPENPLAKISRAISRSDIEFAEHPAFNKKYFLHGYPGDEPIIRKLFSRNSLLGFYENLPMPLSTMGFQKSIFIYQSRKLIAPTELRDFLKLATMTAKEISVE